MAPDLNVFQEVGRKEGEPVPYSWRRVLLRHKVILLECLGVILLFIGWQLVSRFKIINPFFISSPSAIAERFIISLLSGQWFEDVIVSLGEFAIG